MRKYILMLLIICATTAIASVQLPAPKNSSQELDHIIAIVNHEVISASQLHAALIRAERQIELSHVSMPDVKALRLQVLNQLIMQKLQLEMAKRYQITATEAEAKSAIKHIANKNKMTVKQLYSKVEETGLSPSQYRAQIRKQIIIDRLLQQAVGGSIIISNDDIREYKEKLTKQRGNHKLYHVIDLLFPLEENASSAQLKAAKAQALQAIQQLKKGESYSRITENNDTDLGWRPLSDLPDIFARKIARLKAGQVAGPIRAGNGFHVIKVLAIRGAKGQAPSDEEIRQMIYTKRFSEKARKFQKHLRLTSYVHVFAK